MRHEIVCLAFLIRLLFKVSLGKTLVLVLNKIDLVEPELSAAWKDYLQVEATLESNMTHMISQF